MHKMKIAAFAAMSAATAAGPALAATTTANLGVSITIANQCKISSTSAIAFGSTGIIDANIDATGSISVRCNKGAKYNISLGAGTGDQATTTDRKMSLGTPGPTAEFVSYALYTDAARTINWGNANISAAPSEYTAANASAATYTVYGRVPVQDTPSAGNYTDTVVVTVTY